jgi:glycosyltransferase involved in cell wall biosynthesis
VRIAVVGDMVRPNGAGIMTLLAADILSEAGHEVIVLAGAMHAELERTLAEVHFAAAAFSNDERALDGSVTESDHVAFLASFRRWFDHQLDVQRPDVLYVHNCGRVFDQLDLADLSSRIPLAHTMHDEWFFTDAHYTFRSSRQSPTVRTFEPGRAESSIEHRYDHLFDVPNRTGKFLAIGPSHWITERAAEVFPSLDIIHLPNAVDTSLFDLQDRESARVKLGLPLDRPIILFVGAPTQERKGFAILERALRSMRMRNGREPMCVIAGGSASTVTDGLAPAIGPGPIAELLARPTASPLGSLGASGDVLVLSGLDRSLMPTLYSAADVLVHPSIIDNLPTVPIEAGLCGLNCLASNVGGTRETIADRRGLFPLDISPSELGELIGEALMNVADETPEDRQRRRDAQLQRFSIEAHRGALVPLLDSLAQRGVE